MNELIQKYAEFLNESRSLGPQGINWQSTNFESFMFWLTKQQNKLPINQCQHRYPTEANHTSTGIVDTNICMICGIRK